MKRKLTGILLAAMFVLGSHKGYLALWKEDRPEPFQIFPVKISLLPEEDQAALEKGIRARSEIELSSLLEDFLS
ncbi:MAG: hypothetical protein IJE81_04160 [Oscillospiraceae bacterium]|nr:hypothetical protein [Oscillospiraceae bacterium]MBQ7129580.1 hypothetical protein [Oscillospiraceae bacterium]